MKTGLHIGVELGGTGCKLAIYKENGDAQLEQVFLHKVETSQSDANVTTQSLIDAGKEAISGLTGKPFADALPDSMGIAAFGPVCLDETSPQYGCITTTPKLAW